MRLRGFINEMDTSSATNMEAVIVALWDGKESPHPELTDIGNMAVDFLRSRGISGNSSHMGSGSTPITDNWKKWGGTDTTPKTDLIIGKYRISLKKAGGSQLMSAKKGESTATCHAGLKDANIESGPIVEEMERYLEKMIEGKSEFNITQQKEQGIVSDDVLDAEKMHKEFQKYLRDLLNSNTILKNSIVHEAMTGDNKFGEHSMGRAGWVFVYDPKGVDMSLNNTDDPAFVSKKAQKTRIVIGWKSVSSTTQKSGKVYSYFSAFRLTESINNHIIEEISKYDGKLLTEGILSNIIDRVKRWFKSIWEKVKTWLLQSFDNVLTFFNLIPNIEMSETIF